MSKNFDIYPNMDKIDYELLFYYEPGTSWPKNKQYTIVKDGIEFKIKTYWSKGNDTLECVRDYDAYSAIDTMLTRDEVVERIRKEDPNGRSDAAFYASESFDEDALIPLTHEQAEQRKQFITAIANMLNNQDAMMAIFEAAPKKKNGTFHKNRYLKIASSGIASAYSCVYAIVGHIKTDTSMSITFNEYPCKIGDNERWKNDVISTYPEGTRLREVLDEVIKE